ncbi:hypothetical protein [Pseudomonas sp.]|uniref:hypothetical protein n=1 Tax=Pseudomonas sp. TaxID=306 RepID=UPI002BC206CE|nr:hypothetical protein [Pseudomonas sp.]
MRTASLACALALCAPLALAAQADKVDIVSHLNGLNIVIEPLGVPPRDSNAVQQLVGVRAVKVLNQTSEAATCEFHVEAKDRTSTDSPVFTVGPNSQVIERVPGEYAPDKPYAELTCKPTKR